MSYRCGECGYESAKWMGFCPRCRGEGELLAVEPDIGGRRVRPAAVWDLTREYPRSAVVAATGIDEVDRVLGGGLVPGSAVLLGGEPGVGKSTLALQLAAALSRRGARVMVTSAEESPAQVGLRAARLGVDGEMVLATSERDVDAVVAASLERDLDLLVVDSVQTVSVAEIGGAPGGVSQVREAAARLVHHAKETDTAVILIGHVTKDGAVAGPKVLEHAVDVVLYFEGDVERGLRLLRCLKNRFGPTHEVGLFEMRTAGLFEIADPTGVLLPAERGGAPGSIVFPAVDGRRPLLVEVQALVASSPLAQPRRSVKGIEPTRIHQVLAVLERHGHLSFAGHDVYVSIAGGLRLRDPGVDLAAALALSASLLDRPLGPSAAWGEVGLTGEIRSVPYADQRGAEASRLGFERVYGPNGHGPLRIEEVLEEAGMTR